MSRSAPSTPQTREMMQDELLRLWRSTGKTILMVTHDVKRRFISRAVSA